MSKSRISPFRADEVATHKRDEAVFEYSRGFKTAAERKAAADFIDEVIAKHGPVVDGYPSWHPFVDGARESPHPRGAFPRADPVGFKGLDHTIYFRNAFLTAPYSDPERVIESAKNRDNHQISAEEIKGIPLYYYKTTPVLVKCEGTPEEDDTTISKRYALGRMLSSLLPNWKWAECGETWADMRRYILGSPCGTRSSLFVNQDTGSALKEVFEMLNKHELFGPIRTD